eukprot:gene2928-8173_t
MSQADYRYDDCIRPRSKICDTLTRKSQLNSNIGCESHQQLKLEHASRQSVDMCQKTSNIVDMPGDIQNIPTYNYHGSDTLSTHIPGMHSLPPVTLCEDGATLASEFPGMHSNAYTHEREATNRMYAHVCNICGKEFKSKCHLADHFTVHSGLKPHICRVCGLSFSVKSNCRRHERSHERPRQQCPICHKMFMSNTQLKRHMKTQHEQRHKCSLCGQIYTRQADLNRHIQTLHENVEYPCEFCGKIYSYRTNLTRHLRACKHRDYTKRMNTSQVLSEK